MKVWVVSVRYIDDGPYNLIIDSLWSSQELAEKRAEDVEFDESPFVQAVISVGYEVDHPSLDD